MRVIQKLAAAALSLALLIPFTANASVAWPALEIQLTGNDTGAVLTKTATGYDFDIDATVLAIIYDKAPPTDINDQAFTLHGTFDAKTSLFYGKFDVAGGLLLGTFDTLKVDVTSAGDIFFGSDLTYIGGSLMTALGTGRIEGSQITKQLNLAGKLGAIAPVPVPAAVWLFGTGLIGLVGVARRKA